MKKTITVNVDVDLWETARNKSLNISEICNEALRSKVGVKEISKESEEQLMQEVELAKKFSLSESELFLLKDNFEKDIVSFWKYNKSNFSNIKNVFDLIEIRKAFKPLWSKEAEEKIQEVKT